MFRFRCVRLGVLGCVGDFDVNGAGVLTCGFTCLFIYLFIMQDLSMCYWCGCGGGGSVFSPVSFLNIRLFTSFLFFSPLTLRELCVWGRSCKHIHYTITPIKFLYVCFIFIG